MTSSHPDFGEQSLPDSGFGVSDSGRKASFCSSHTTFQGADAPCGISSTHVHFFS